MRLGEVFFVGVPIGNYKDITFRALDTLKSVSLILCEDTRETKLLLDNFLIKKDLISYIGSYDFAIQKALLVLRGQESIAIVSDRGMPCISDPGADLVSFFRALSFKVSVIPGVSSLTTAFTLSGLNGGFFFAGFFPKKSSQIANYILSLLPLDTHLVFFESSHRIAKTLLSISEVVQHEIIILKELTKTYEGVLIGTPIKLSLQEIKGELVVIIPRKNK